MVSVKGVAIFFFCAASHLFASARSFDEESPLVSIVQRGNMQLARDMISDGELKHFPGPKDLEKIYTKLRIVDSLLSNGIVDINTSGNDLDKATSDKGAFDVILIPDSCLVTHLIVNVTAVKNWCNKTVTDGRKPIHMISALPDVSPSIVQIIFENGIDNVNTKTDSEVTPLMLAATSGNLEVVRFLVEKGARINDVASVSFDGKEEMDGRFAFAKLFSKKGLSVAKSEFHYSALVAAVISNKIRIVTYLISKGADVNNSGQAWLVLFHPVYHGQTEMVDILLQNGVDINSKDMLGSTALHKVAKSGHVAMAEFLLKNGACVNATDVLGWKPLHVSSFFSENGGNEMIRLLVQSGSDVESITDGGYSPLNLVIAGHDTDFLSYLVKNFDSLQKTENHLPQVDSGEIHTGIVESIIQLGARLNGQDDVLGWSPLHWAAATGDYEVARMLVNGYGAVVSLRSKMDLDPFETATLFGRTKVADFLKTAKDLVK